MTYQLPDLEDINAPLYGLDLANQCRVAEIVFTIEREFDHHSGLVACAYMASRLLVAADEEPDSRSSLALTLVAGLYANAWHRQQLGIVIPDDIAELFDQPEERSNGE